MIGLDGGTVTPVAPHAPPADPAGLAGSRPPGGIEVRRAGSGDVQAYRRLRRSVFVGEQGLFATDDADRLDQDPATEVLVAVDHTGAVVGGVRVTPARAGRAGRDAAGGDTAGGDTAGGDTAGGQPAGGDAADGWWVGSRLAVDPVHRRQGRVGAALVRAACALVEQAGALRFDAEVQVAAEPFFASLGWQRVGSSEVAGAPHVSMQWPIRRIEHLARGTKAALAGLLDGLAPGGAGWVGDDGAPVPGSDVIAASDAILPSMVERDPEWAGWCAVLVNCNDLGAMGATPVALLDVLAAPTATAAARVLAGLRAAAAAYGVPVIGGHTQLGVPAALSVTALGTTRRPVPGGGGRPGDEVRLTVDLAGGWRPGYRGGQWDSTSTRAPADLRRLLGTVARLGPAAAKDVSMAGIVGTLGMLAEASGCGAELDVAALPRPAGTVLGDWLTCFPGFAMLTAHRPGGPQPAPGDTAPAASAVCGRLVPGAGVRLVWPDGRRTTAIASSVTGMGPAGGC